MFARVDAGGAFVVENGRVEIRYKPNDGRKYGARPDNLTVVSGQILPDETCSEASAVPDAKKTGATASGMPDVKKTGANASTDPDAKKVGANASTTTEGDPPKAAAAAKGAASTRVRRGSKSASSKGGAHTETHGEEAHEKEAHGKEAGAEASGTQPIHVYADGACSGNPGPAGIGVVVLDSESRVEISEYIGKGTNNIAELTAILRALMETAESERPLVIHTDSSYSIGVLQKGWKAKANQELVAELREVLRHRRGTRLVYVPGHAGVKWNERADSLARAAVESRSSARQVVRASQAARDARQSPP